jgi:outer membrane lipoprotein SlyB
MKHVVVAAVTACFVLTSIPAAEAKGCLKGAAIGGVAGHLMHHHAILGAAVGCVIGHHMAVKKQREEKARQHEQQQWQEHQGHAQHAI